MLTNVELMCLYWTTAGVFPGNGEISPYDFRARVEAAARAGFKGVGLWHTDLEHCTLHRSLKEMKSILDDNDIRYLELEFLTDWFIEGGRRSESDSRRRRLMEAAEVLRAKHIKVGDFYNTPCPMTRIVEAFAALCAQAEQAGTTVGFEMMGSSMISNLPDTISMLESAGAKNGGIILDIIQLQYLGIPYPEVARIPIKYLLGIELNDGALPDSPNHDPARARRFCGEGEWDIRGLIRTVQQMGYQGPWAVEVMSEELVQVPLDALARRAYQTTMAEFSDL